MNDPIITAGIDIAKAHLDLCILDRLSHERFDYDQAGLELLIDRLKEHQVQLVVFEATGRLEAHLMVALAQTSIAYHCTNPRQIRDFAKAMNQLNKTDKVDARIIAQFARDIRPKPQSMPEKTQLTLKACLTRYQQVMTMRVAERHRLSRTDDPFARDLIQKSIEYLNEQISTCDKQIKKLLKENPATQSKVKQLVSVPGIGQRTACRLVAMLPELGQCNRQQIARLVGVAPINRDSGTMRGKRMIGGGRKTLRTALYMPVLVAVKHNPILRDAYEHLLAQGKAKKAALVACMRKLIILLNTMVRNNKNWEAFTQNT